VAPLPLGQGRPPASRRLDDRAVHALPRLPDRQFGGGLRLGEFTRGVMHCHNVNHEDHAMMLTFNAVP
jgi:hypothetical protein